MERSLWTAATGMAAQQTNMDVIAHNLANVNTTGFKKTRAEFQDLLYQTVTAPGTASSASTNVPQGIQIGLGARTAAVKRIFLQGDFRPTDNPFDLVIEGDGFFPLVRPDGAQVFTRDGALTTDENGNLVSSVGYSLDPPISVPQDAKSLTVGRDGTVSVRLADETITQIGSIELASFINPTGLQSIGNNLYVPTVASGDPLLGTPGQDGLGEIGQGFLETSNVSIVTELVDMISAQRAYELNSRSVRASDEMLRSLAQLIR
ncbi:MAG: flagellar basal-body rod protein FlgG [Acidobacteriota bacterium]|nr:MAG: flagellar basal-body rod protein FlgG [Acidobacteriota bacterium]